MPSITSLISQLHADYPALSFEPSDEYRWIPDQKTILYLPGDNHATEQLLHELAHAVLGHNDYTKDIELIKLERDAWQYAKDTLADTYNVALTDTVIQNSLDTYRDWLHARSTCPACRATGIQTEKYLYKCLVCSSTWRANEARSCALRRYCV